MRRLTAATLVLLTGLVTAGLAGCGASGRSAGSSGALTSSSTPSPTPSPAASTPAATAPTETASTPPFPADTSADTGTASADAHLTVSDVAVGAHDGYDRVVLTLGGTGSPGWRAEYVDSPVDDPSDQVVPVTGNAFLRVVIDGSGYPQDTGVTEWSGSPLRPVGLTQVREVNVRGVFEGQTLAFVGLDHVAAFRVFALVDPTRLVIDVQH